MLAMRRERIRRGWSLMDLAMRCRIDPGALSRIERRKWPCCPGWRRRIAAAFNMPEEVLFEEVPADDEHGRK